MAKAEELKKAVDKTIEMPLDELRSFLPTLMDEIKEFGVGKLMRYSPDLLPKLLRRIDKQAGKFARETPEGARKFMDVLLESAKVMFQKNPKVREILESAKEVKINYECTDIPLKGHLKIGGGKFSSGFTLLGNADVKLTGPADVLVGIMSGDVEAVPAYMAGKYKIEGNLQLVLEAGMMWEKVRKILEESRKS